METKKIFDIFSAKKLRREKEPIKVLADYREKNSFVVSEMISLGMDVEFKNLKVGDYIVNNIAIERKTVFDFISSMKNKRLANQLEEMQQYKDKLLIVEGIEEQDLYSDRNELTGMHPNAVRGFLLSILLKYKVPIIFTKNSGDTAKFIFVLSRKKERESSLNVSKRNLNKKERKQFILESFHGIGPKTAKKLLKKFKTVKNVINASYKDLKKEIGKKSEAFKVAYENY